MFTQPTKKHLKYLVSASLALILAGLFVAPMAFARIVHNTIDPVAVAADNGRQIVVMGPVICTAGERAYHRVTVTQRSTGAVAEGRTLINCTGEIPSDIQQWEILAEIQGKQSFEEGPATAVAIARTTTRGEITDAHQWLVEITLVNE